MYDVRLGIKDRTLLLYYISTDQTLRVLLGCTCLPKGNVRQETVEVSNEEAEQTRSKQVVVTSIQHLIL